MFEPDRFNSSQLFHMDIQFENAVAGPLAVGDGRWLGRGLMRPVRLFRQSGKVTDAPVEVPEPEEEQDAEAGAEA